LEKRGKFLGAVSGGVDSTIAAMLLLEAIGDRFHTVLMDNGVMCLHGCEEVKETLIEYLGINLTVVDASELFLKGLKGIANNPEQNWKLISNIFINVFEAEVKKVEEAAANSSKVGKVTSTETLQGRSPGIRQKSGHTMISG
jgi:GMP synthase (glutamine-hydrolysing)